MAEILIKANKGFIIIKKHPSKDVCNDEGIALALGYIVISALKGPTSFQRNNPLLYSI